MKYIKRLIFCIAVLIPAMLHAQIDTVLVEKYYISDANDAAITDDGTLPEGSVTYRVFIKLDEGYTLKSLFGNADQPFSIWSTKPFYNNASGKSFGYDIKFTSLKYNTVALDTWLTLSLTNSPVKKGTTYEAYTGVLKGNDPDTSIIGGLKNSDNMLNATSPLAGISLVQKDGMVKLTGLPIFSPKAFVTSNGISGEMSSLTDTSIFSSEAIAPDTLFAPEKFTLTEINGNISATDNFYLVAQLTTLGELNFTLNVEVKDRNGNTVNCVAANPKEGEVFDQNLTYPNIYIPKCGCPDMSFMEYDSDRECDSVELCKTKIVLGCMDEKACNYNPEANVSDGLCCYPGGCGGRDITFVCPEMGIKSLEFQVFPNPASETLQVEFNTGSDKKTKCMIVDPYGRVIQESDFGIVNAPGTKEINVTTLPKGIYMVKVYRANENGSKLFIKD